MPNSIIHTRSALYICCCLFIVLGLSGCGGRPRGYVPEEARTTPYLPPTAAAPAASATLEVIEETISPRPTPTPPCTSNLTFIEDLTIPDGTRALPGQKLDKRWLVENSGVCNWEASFRIRLIAGPSIGAETEQALFPARSGSQATIRINFIAPTEVGTYRSAWQAHDPLGQPFGDLFFIDFVVTDSPTP